VIKANFDDIIANGAAATQALPFLAGYTETRVVDEQTAVVVFEAPDAPFLQAAAGVSLAPVALSTLEVPFDERATTGLVGTGPFTLESYTANSEVVLTRRDDYAWGPETRSNDGAAYLDSIEFPIIPEAGVRTGVLTSGQVGVIGGVPPQDVETLDQGAEK
jgi:peptide/nickel transport system substrate-binding protein